MSAIHAFWLNTPGPEMTSGVSLHYVCDNEQTPAGQPFWLPSIDWWPSVIRFHAGDKGFTGLTEKLVSANYDGLVIHESAASAVQAWRDDQNRDKEA